MDMRHGGASLPRLDRGGRDLAGGDRDLSLREAVPPAPVTAQVTKTSQFMPSSRSPSVGQRAPTQLPADAVREYAK